MKLLEFIDMMDIKEYGLWSTVYKLFEKKTGFRFIVASS